jgi:hypothetical protein
VFQKYSLTQPLLTGFGFWFRSNKYITGNAMIQGVSALFQRCFQQRSPSLPRP